MVEVMDWLHYTLFVLLVFSLALQFVACAYADGCRRAMSSNQRQNQLTAEKLVMINAAQSDRLRIKNELEARLDAIHLASDLSRDFEERTCE